MTKILTPEQAKAYADAIQSPEGDALYESHKLLRKMGHVLLWRLKAERHDIDSISEAISMMDTRNAWMLEDLEPLSGADE